MSTNDARTARTWTSIGWIVAFALLASVRLWNGITGPLLRGYDDHGHVGYLLYLHLYGAVPWADQGWSYFHPPLHYLLALPLTWLGDTEVLLHGLALVGGASSLGIAYLAARVTRLASPSREDLALLVFVSVGLLPVYLYSSTMAGNELTAAFFGTFGLSVLVANECRAKPLLRLDALVGLLLGLALLSKVSAVLILGACGLTLAFRALRQDAFFAGLLRIAVRSAVLAGVALIVASPYYLRNVQEFGTPFKMSRDNPHVARLEALQEPGSRTWLDFVHLPPKLLLDPNPREDHLLHSVWGSAYAQLWADSRMSWDTVANEHQARIRTARSVMVFLGLVPTLLVLAGSFLAFRDVVRGRRAAVYTPMFCTAALSLASFAYFALAAPQFSALKASYLLGLTLPWALFLARAIEALRRVAWATGVAAVLVGIPALASALVHADGVVLPRLGDHKALASVFFHFGDLDAARRSYQENRRVVFGPTGAWTDNLAAISLVEGDAYRAQSLLVLEKPHPKQSPFRWNALAVAAALTGEPERAIGLVDDAIEAGAGEVGLTNRGVLRTVLGDFDRAEADLREALALDSMLAPAWHALAELLVRTGRGGEAAEARAAARAAAGRAPRGHPYGIPDGLGQYPSWSLDFRWMLWPEGSELRLARAPFRAADAIAMRAASEQFAGRPHVVLIVIDTLRADHLGAYGYARPTSPNIDRLAAEGVRFARAYAASSWTLPSVASLFTSKEPAEHAATAWGRRLDADAVTFVEMFQAAGYRTVGVSGNFVHITEKIGFARGFDEWKELSYELEGTAGEALFIKKQKLANGERDIRLRPPSASEVNAAIFERLPPPEPRPLFLYVHYMDPHSAYDPPPDERRRFATDPADRDGTATVTSAYLGQLVRREVTVQPDERQRIIDLYDAEIAAADRAVGELVKELVARGFGDELIVAVVSDHGEAFGEHGSWFHGLNLHRESLEVPFVLWDSRRSNRGVVVEDAVDLLDVPTTLLGLADVERAPGMRGRRLLSGRPRFARALVATLERDRLFEDHLRPRRHRRAVTHWPWKIIVDRRRVARVYQLEEDPDEIDPLEPDDARVSPVIAAVARQLEAPEKPERKLQKRRARKRAAKQRRKNGEPSPLERERLRALGYAD